VIATAAVAIVVLAGCGAAQDVLDAGAPTSPATPSPAPATPETPDEPSTPSSPSSLPAGFGKGPPGSGLQRFYDQQVTWSSCEGGECASFWVPLDYHDPDGPAITIKAERHPATDPAQRRGSLLINPGGPGESGIEYLGFIGLDPSVTAKYDVIGFDPRGVGQSTPIDCLTDAQLDDYVAADPTPDTDAEVKQMQDEWARYAQGCLEKSWPLIEHVSTVEVARDMDIIRAVVGDRKLNYFGASYGTYIGATYAGLFPKKVGRMVLDGAVDPLASPHKTFLAQAVGFETALTAYLEYCVDGGDCPLGDTVDEARNRLIKLLEDIDAHPLPAADGREVTEGIAFLGVILPLYSRDLWPYLTQALQQALDGQGDVLAVLADIYTKRQRDGSYSSNAVEAQQPVNCLDHPEHKSLAQIEAAGPEFIDKAPVFGHAAMWFDYGCSNWPVKSTEQQPSFAAKGAGPIVVVGTTRDPATPYQQAVNLANELDSGVLLSRDGDGHTAYHSGNACIDQAIDTYLADGTPPKDGTMC
jgi:pimeloyl-ACP methyl ester carboxylesterase